MNKGFFTFVSVLSVIIILTDIYTYRGINAIITDTKIASYRTIINIVYWTFSIGVILGVLLLLSFWSNKYTYVTNNLWIILSGALMISFLPKLFFSVFYGVDDILYFIVLIYNKILGNSNILHEVNTRIYLITKIGAFISILVFVLIAYGISFEKYWYKFKENSIYYSNLPKSFDGFTIVQISDIHLGSFLNNKRHAIKVFEKINKLNPDIIVCTGDWVNNYSDEMEGWQNVFLTLKSKKGNYAILGNHDYSDYVPWNNIDEKKENLENLKRLIKESGFKLLLNENVKFINAEDTIVLAGMENWGKVQWSKRYGKIDKALSSTDISDFVVLLSHDPSHWDEEIKEKTNVALTLSGHTHGMQFSIFGWSPVKYFYPKWTGLHKFENQYLYVNTGFGFIGFPGRVFMRPEVSVFRIKVK